MAITYNPRDTRYQNNDQRYSDWVAQGRPSTDMYGNELDVRGEVIGSDAWTNDYYRQNASDLARIYGNAGVQATLNNTRDRSVEDPWNTALRGSNPTPSPIITGRNMPKPVVGNQPSPVQLPIGSRQPGTMPGGTSRADWNRTNPNYGGTPVVNNQPSPVQLPAGSRQPNPVVSRQQALTTNPNYGGYRPTQGVATPNNQVTAGRTNAVQQGITNQGVPKVGEEVNTGATTQQRPWNVSQNGMFTLNGEELGRSDPRLYGQAGNLGRGTNVTTSATNPNPNYWIEDGSVTDEAGNTTYNWRLRPEITARLNGRVQVSQNGIGGFDEVIDASRVEYDPEFGFLTTPDNISQDDPGPARRAMFIRNAILAMGAAGAAGLLPGTPGGLALPGAEAIAGTGAETIAGTGALAESTAPVVTETMVGAPALSLPGAGAAAAGASTGATTGAAAGGGAAASGLPASITSLLPSGVTASQFFSALRAAGSVAGAIRMLTGGQGGGSGSGGGSLGGTPGQLIQGGLANYQANRNIGSYNTMINEMLTRGDPYAGERANAIQRLRALESNPGSITSNPLFQSMNDKSQADLQRIFAARGLSISGNEMGGLQENFLANMNKFYGDEWNRIAREAGVFFDPTNIAAAGMRSAGDMFGARTNRDAGTQTLISMLRGGQGGGTNIVDTLTRIFGGSNNSGGMSDQEFEDWWNTYLGNGGSPTNDDPMPYDDGGYGGW